MAQLIIQSGDGETIIHELEGGHVTIGRGSDNFIVIADPSVSAHHSQITCGDNNFTLRDLRSANGTEVNGEKIHEMALKNGDRISFGGVEVIFLRDQFLETSNGVPSMEPPCQLIPASFSTNFSKVSAWMMRKAVPIRNSSSVLGIVKVVLMFCGVLFILNLIVFTSLPRVFLLFKSHSATIPSAFGSLDEPVSKNEITSADRVFFDVPNYLGKVFVVAGTVTSWGKYGEFGGFSDEDANKYYSYSIDTGETHSIRAYMLRSDANKLNDMIVDSKDVGLRGLFALKFRAHNSSRGSEDYKNGFYDYVVCELIACAPDIGSFQLADDAPSLRSDNEAGHNSRSASSGSITPTPIPTPTWYNYRCPVCGRVEGTQKYERYKVCPYHQQTVLMTFEGEQPK